MSSVPSVGWNVTSSHSPLQLDRTLFSYTVERAACGQEWTFEIRVGSNLFLPYRAKDQLESTPHKPMLSTAFFLTQYPNFVR